MLVLLGRIKMQIIIYYILGSIAAFIFARPFAFLGLLAVIMFVCSFFETPSPRDIAHSGHGVEISQEEYQRVSDKISWHMNANPVALTVRNDTDYVLDDITINCKIIDEQDYEYKDYSEFGYPGVIVMPHKEEYSSRDVHLHGLRECKMDGKLYKVGPGDKKYLQSGYNDQTYN